MSIQESAAQLVSLANQVVETGIGASNNVGEALSAAAQRLSAIKEISNESMAKAVGLLGAGHAGVGAIGATANNVSGAADSVSTAIEHAIQELLSLDHAINTHSNTISSIGHNLMQGGS